MLFPDWLSRWNRISNPGRMPRRGGRRNRQHKQSAAVVVDQLEPRQLLAASMGPVASAGDAEPIIVAAGSNAETDAAAATVQSRLDGLLQSALESSRRRSNSLDPVATADVEVNGLPLSQLVPVNGNRIAVDIHVSTFEGTLEQLKELGLDVTSTAETQSWRLVGGLAELESLEQLSLVDGVERIVAPRLTHTVEDAVGEEANEFEALSGADRVRELLADIGSRAEGTGQFVRIGVISNTFNQLINDGNSMNDSPTVADQQAEGDLPPNDRLTILDDTCTFNCVDEGRAMIELMLDIVPEAEFVFHTRGNGSTDFVNAIQDLTAAGVDIIVDDVSRYDQPHFQDGPLVQALEQAYEDEGVLYFGSAGNSNQRAYRGTWRDTNNNGYLEFVDVNGAVLGEVIQVTAASASFVSPLLHWAEPFTNSTTDLDVEIWPGGVIPNGMNAPLRTSSGTDTASQPVASTSFQNAAMATQTFDIRVRDVGLVNPAGLDLYMNFERNGVFAVNANALNGMASVAGNHHSENSFIVAAVPATNLNQIEGFSSRGPVTHYFDGNGNALPLPETRQLPNLAAADRITTTTFGFLNFSGTSAASPNAAATAALILDVFRDLRADENGEFFNGVVPDLTFDEMFELLTMTTQGTNAGSWDNTFGWGVVNALGAIHALEGSPGGTRLFASSNPLTGGFGDLALGLGASSVSDDFTFRALADGVATITLTPDGSGIDPAMLLWDKGETNSNTSDDVLLRAAYDGAPDGDVQVSFDVEAGHLYSGVVFSESTLNTPGAITVSAIGPLADLRDVDIDEMGNGFAAAFNQSTVPEFFRFEAPADSSGELYITINPDSTTDVDVTLRDGNGEALLQEDRLRGGDNETVNFFQVEPGAEYILEVDGDDGNDGDFDFDFYNVDIDFGLFSTVAGTVRHDFDGDGNADIGDVGLAGWTAFLDQNRNGVADQYSRTYFSRDLNLPLRELEPVRSSIFVDGAVGAVRDVTVTVDLSSTDFDDVTATLVGPDGTRVELFSGILAGDGFAGNLRLNDAGVTPIADAGAPASELFLPAESLSAFAGIEATGVWQLELTDTFDGDTATLRHWSLEIVADEPTSITNGIGQYRFDQLTRGFYEVGVTTPEGFVVTHADYEVSRGIEGATTGFAGTEGGDDPAAIGSGSVTEQVHSTDDLATAFASNGLGEVRGTPSFAGLDGTGYSIVIIDSELDTDHPDFGADLDNDGIADRIVFTLDLSDSTDETADFNVNDPPMTMQPQHGTPVTAAAASSDPVRQAPASGANIIFLKVRSDDGTTWDYELMADALQWVVDNAEEFNVAAVNVSQSKKAGGFATAPDITLVSGPLAQLDQMNVIVVATPGNQHGTYNSQAGANYFSANPHALSVGAIWDRDAGAVAFRNSQDFSSGPDRLISFTNRHERVVDIFAPGGLLQLAARGGGTTMISGTSFAAPQVAGYTVLAQQLAEEFLGRRLSLVEYRELLRQTAVRIHDGDDEDDDVVNTGGTYPRIDFPEVVRAIIGLQRQDVARAFLSPDASLTEVDLLVTSTVDVSGVSFHDRDGDARRDSNEPGHAGRTIFADLNDNNRLDNDIATQRFSAVGVPADVPARGTMDLTVPVTGVVGTVSRIGFRIDAPGADFQQVSLEFVSPSGTVVPRGELAQGMFGEEPNGDWTVRVTNESADPFFVRSFDLDIAISEPFTLTDQFGRYSLSLQPVGINGTYTIREDPVSGHVLTTPETGGHGLPDRTSGQRYLNQDFGSAETVNLLGEVFEDRNANGVQDDGEGTLSARTVYLDVNEDGRRDEFLFRGSPDASRGLIPDGGTLSLPLNQFARSGRLVDLDVLLDIEHSLPGDLEIALISPDGNRHVLIDRVGGVGEGFRLLRLNDEAEVAIEDGEAPFSGPHRPQSLLSALNGRNVRGRWLLEVTDTATNGVTGRVNDWDLEFTTGDPVAETDEDGRFLFRDFPPGEYLMRIDTRPDEHVSAPDVALHNVLITSGQGRGGLDFGVFRDAALTGIVYEDEDGDGSRGLLERRMAGVTVFLDVNGNGIPDAETRTVTASELPARVDNPTDTPTIRNPVFVDGLPASVADVEVSLDINVDFANRMSAALVSPAGTRIQLFDRVGGFGDGFIQTRFDDSAETAIADGEASFTGTFQPAEPLSSFNGEDPSGTWFLELTDNSPRLSDVPVLAAWSLTVTADELQTTSSESGDYRFERLRPGDYSVTQVVPLGFVQSEPESAAHPVTVTSGRTAADIDFGNFQPAQIDGLLFEDLNADGVRDLTDPALEGRTVFLDTNENGVFDDGLDPTTTSASDGTYSLTGLRPGTFFVGQVLPDGWRQSFPQDELHEITVRSGESAPDVRFGSFLPGTVTGVKWLDENGNGQFDATESGLEGWLVFLDANANGRHDLGELSATTSAQGDFAINGILPGEYTLREEDRDGFLQTFPVESLQEIGGHEVSIISQTKLTDRNFGNAEPVSVAGVKFDDRDGNGQRGPDEPGLGGVIIFDDANANGLLDQIQSIHFGEGDIAIPDSGAATSSVVVSGLSGRVIDVDVTLNIEHPNAEELDVFLVSPAGTRVELFSDVGGTERDVLATLDDEALLEITEGAAPFQARFRPEGSLADLFNEHPNGTWSLEVTDDSPLFTGRIASWQLELTTGEVHAVTAPDGSYLINGMRPGLHTISEIVPRDSIQTAPADFIHKVTLSSGETATGLDFGNREFRIGGTKYHDRNANGQRDNGEEGLPGWRIFVDENGNGRFDSETTFFELDALPRPLPNSSATVFGLNVENLFGQLADVNVHLDIDHNLTQGLSLTLVSPAGTQVELFSGVGGVNGRNFTGTILDDEALVPIESAAAPFSGRFRPEGRLSDFRGEEGIGLWQLVVRDEFGFGRTLNRFELELTTGESSDVTDQDGRYAITAGALSLIELREVVQAGWTQTQPSDEFHAVDIFGGQLDGFDFGNVQAGVFGRVFDDLNGDGSRTDNEPGLDRIDVFLDSNENEQLDESQTVVSIQNAPVGIPDGSSVAATIDVSNLDGSINDLDVALRIAHTQIGEVAGTLISPEGTQVRLFFQNGADGDHLQGTVFDDEAGQSINDGEPPFTGAFRPRESLEAFDGESPNGTWTLLLEDSFAEGTGGQLQEFSLHFSHGERRVATDENGEFVLSGLPDGTHQIGVVALPGQSITAPASPLPGFHAVTLDETNLAAEGFEFGLASSATIAGTAYLDINANGTRDDGELPLEGRTIFVDVNGNGLLDDGIDLIQNTSQDGSFAFTDLLPGDYVVRQVLPDGFRESQPGGNGHQLTLISGQFLSDVDFGSFEPSTEIRGFVFHDENSDGERNPNEAGLPGFTVFLDTDEDGVRDESSQSVRSGEVPRVIVDDSTVVSTLTIAEIDGLIFDADVQLRIAHPDVGDLSATLIAPNGLRVELFADLLAFGADFSNTVFDDEASASILVAPAPFPGRFRPTGSLSSLNGLPANGTWTLEITDSDSGATGQLESWSLNLTAGDPTQVTGLDGSYAFENLAAGSFNVHAVTEPGWRQTVPANPSHRRVTLSQGETALGQDFGFVGLTPATPVLDLRAISDSGESDTDNLTNITRDGFAQVGVTTDPFNQVELFIDGSSAGLLTDNGSGQVTFFLSSIELAEGTRTLTARTRHGSGMESLDSAPLTVEVDLTSPSAVLVNPLDNGSGDADMVSGQVTVDTLPERLTVSLGDLNGIGFASARDRGTVRLTVDGRELIEGIEYGYELDEVNSTIELEPTLGVFLNGTYSLTLGGDGQPAVRDRAGNVITETTLTVVVDGPVLENASVDLGEASRVRVHLIENERVEIQNLETSEVLFSRPHEELLSLTLTGDADRSESVEVDFGGGDPLPMLGLNFDAGPSGLIPAPGDSLTVRGTGQEFVEFLPDGDPRHSGAILIDGASITFDGVGTTGITAVDSVSYVALDGQSVFASATQRISQFENGVESGRLTFSDVTSLSIDAASNDAPDSGDVVLVSLSPVAAGLNELAIRTGSGHDRIDLAFAEATGIRVDAGAGDDVIIHGDGDGILNGGDGLDQVRQTHEGTQRVSDSLLTGRGAAQLLSIEQAFLTGSLFDDFIDASQFSGDVTVVAGDGDDLVYGGDGDDDLRGGEGDDVIRGGAGNDNLAGDSGADRLLGQDGDDVLRGGSRDDILEGGAGNDELSGEDGFDQLYGGTGDDDLDGGAGDDRLQGEEGDDILSGGSGFDRLLGDAGDDQLRGGGDDDIINGGSGNDFLAGEAGFDFLSGDLGNDMLEGGTEDDRLLGGGGHDVLNTGSGFDTAIGNSGNDRLVQSVAGDVSLTLRKLESDTGEVWIRSILDVELHGSDFADNFDTTAMPVGVVVFAGGGNDIVLTGPGSDFVDAGAGDDRVETEAGNDEVHGGDGDDDIRTGIGNDVVHGDAGDDFIDSGSRDDLVHGGAGDDEIHAGSGNDEAHGGDGNDQVFGGTGNDLLGGDAGDDELFGEDGDDNLWGGAGADQLHGAAGNDMLMGQGSSGDILIGSIGDDILDGGMGTDTVQEEADSDFTLTDAALISLLSGSDQLANLEQARLTAGDSDNTIDARGFGGSTVLFGGGGNDLLIGGRGRDFIFAGAGNDTARGNSGDDGLFGDSGNDVLDGGDGNDTARGSAGRDVLIGGAGNDELMGQGGSGDILIGGAGDDLLDGGGGIDRIVETADSDFVLTDRTLVGGLSIGTDKLSSIEQANLTGGAGANTLDASAFSGKTVLSGRDGNDILLGGSDNDILSGGDGKDQITGGAGSDRVDGGADADSIDVAEAPNPDGIDQVVRDLADLVFLDPVDLLI